MNWGQIEKLRTGDIYFVSGKTWLSAIIKLLTFGKMTHCGLVVNPTTIFETDGSLKKAKYRSIDKLLESKVEVYRPLFLNEDMMTQIGYLCGKYNGTPYDYWDVFLNAIFFWLPTEKKKKLIEKLGCKALLKCDEMTMMIMFKATGYKGFERWISSNPNELHKNISEVWDKDFILFLRLNFPFGVK